ncbi:MAG: hypothetical protein KF770_20830 [Anaerolineae bacterium]|nr:hypothetical protein [Anaerolineae bacterium]
MNSKQVNKKWLLLIPAFLLAAMLGILFQQEAASLPTEEVTIVYWETDSEYGVNYGYAVDNLAHEAVAEIYPDYSSVEGIYSYRDFSHKELADLLKNLQPEELVPLKITFTGPLTKDEFTDFVTKYEIVADKYTIFLREPDGKIVTVQGSPDEDGVLIPESLLAMAMAGVHEASGTGTESLGWVDVSGLVTAKLIPVISGDKDVFLTDGMEAVLQTSLTDSRLKEAHIPRAVRRDVLAGGFAAVGMPPIASFLYDYGLMEMAGQQN